MAQSAAEPDAARWKRVEEVCDAALKLRQPERDAYLTDACGTDPALRREVEALLAHEQTADKFLSVPLGALAAEAVVDPPRDLLGKTIAGYEIVAKLGEGGMGEVYRARDRQLGRDVAIKVLPAAVANDHERLKRFEREARLLASVNHTGIGAIYGVVEDDGMRALVLELIEGDTLSGKLARGRLKLEQTLALGAQIADALDHAHRRGITHRDLKPSNIMLSSSGVKLLDFGIGKWTPPAGGAMTRESSLTEDGAIVGTLHYMSPEQLEGRAADARSDIFSFGAVLYEMLCGRRAFDGPSQASIIAAVLEAPTPKLTIGGQLAPRLERVVTKCLAKQPEGRWQSARDLGDELRWLASETTVAPGTTAPHSSTPRLHTATAIGLAALVAVLLVGWASDWRAKDSSLAAPISFSERTPDSRLDMGTFDISNDGNQLVYASNGPGVSRILNVRRFDGFDAIGLPGSERAISPVFSPDGEWVAFLTNGAPRTLTKMRIGAEGSQIIVLNDTGPAFELAWPTADTIFIAGPEQPIRKVPANGGRPEDLTTIQADTEVDHHGPVLLPSGNGLLFSVHGKGNRFSIAVQDLRTGERRSLIESGFAPAYSPTGHLLFGRGTSIMAVPFDERSLRLEGDEVTLVEGVSTAPREGQAHYRLSKNGTLAYRPPRSIDGRRLMWVDRAGRETPVGIPPRSFDMPSVSPDGKHLAFVTGQGDRRDIWTSSLDGGTLSRLTEDGDNWNPLWTTDGNGIIHGRRNSSSESKVVLRRVDGTPAETLAADINDLWPEAMSADGKQIVLMIRPPSDDFYLAQTTFGSKQLRTVVKNSGHPRMGRLSPDGRWLAYTENVFNTETRSNRTEVIVQSYPEPRFRRQLTVDGGNHALWSRDGKELFYHFGSRIYAVTIDTSRGLAWRQPRVLFERRILLNYQYSYDVAPDGRFLMVSPAPAEDGNSDLINVVVNWHHELAARVPARR